MVTEYVSGRTFAEALASGRRMAFRQVHSLGRVIAQVLSLLHQKGLVHGSIRPSNIMVSSGVIKLADLGLARLARVAGLTPSYDAPEGGPSPADDLFALCAVMYHLLTATHPLSAARRRAADAFDPHSGRAGGHGQAAAARSASAARAAARERGRPAAGAAGDGEDRLSA